MSTQDHDNFGPNAWLIEELYERYRQDPTSVDESWQTFFAERAAGEPAQAQPAPAARAQVPAAPAAAPAAPAAGSPVRSTPAAPAQAPAQAQAPAPEGRAEQAPAPQDAPTEHVSSAPEPQTRPADPQGRPTDSAVQVVRGDLPPAPPVEAQAATATYRDSSKPIARYNSEGREDEVVKLRGASQRTAKNMETSLEIPVATSVRAVPAKVLVDNRLVINSHLTRSRGGKVSFTHLIGYAMVEALAEVPDMNNSYGSTEDGKPALVRPAHINFGLAVDLPRPDGTRTLVVPSVKKADTLDFAEFVAGYEALVAKARTNELTVEDFQGTTATLTNPGGIGTVHSIPRLMNGQGVIVGVGAMDYPAEYQGASEQTIARLGVSKILTLTSTYDHRIIQGAASGEFLRAIATKLLGEDGFYDRVFVAMQVPYEPVRWKKDTEFDAETELGKPARIAELIHAYRSRGHLMANTDPISYRQRMHADLDITNYGLSLWDLERKYPTGGFGGSNRATLREILNNLRDAYCRTVGIEYMHLADRAQRTWFQERLERPYAKPSSEQQLRILSMLNKAEAFETFLQTKFVGQKRFSLEGGESLIPLLDTILNGAAAEGLDSVAIGMPHRGRLNVLANVAGKSYSQIFGEFEGNFDLAGSGDVKYHLGTEGKHESPDGGVTSVYLAANPSHLEAVDGVLEGVVRAKQDRIDLGDKGFSVLPVLIHGDASFAGQGVVTETLNLSQLPGYRVGGTVHVIVNNQIGFTTSPSSSRSSYYASDIVKGLQIPVLHVNGDDPEAVARVAELAFEFREEFHKDVVIDLVCYRRRGHNEGDDPSMTQPVMYRLIDEKKSVRTLYQESLIGRGDITEEQSAEAMAEFQRTLDEGFAASKDRNGRDGGDSVAGLEKPSAQQEDAGLMVGWSTAVSPAVVERVGEAHARVPEGFTLHPKLKQLTERRVKMAKEGGIDWGMGELIAFGSLLMEGTPVRLAGQDSRRGTFVQRHAVFHDNVDGKEWTPLRFLTPDQAKLWIYDSSLSEYAAMGFEYGYSIERPDALVLWEAQFGDFANGAQIIIDEFISSAEQKWGQSSSLVLLLPHGYEGQGPDHSSARIERFLTLAAQDNMLLVQPSTPGNYFHFLRQQAYAQPRRPMVVFSPKQLLRLKAAASSVEDFTEGALQRVIGEVDEQVVAGGGQVDRVLLCSGRVFYDLAAARKKAGDTRTAIVRLEQLYPVPTEDVLRAIEPFGDAELVWVQDEPANQGAWPFLAANLHVFGRPMKLVSRPAAASPSAGSAKTHAAENAQLVADAFAR
ncbi:multifunctional oxoglutarate decarboxylase/oxoglutarate dehydrogenase thiamine pyrophosphate-binding subunit/dihydrolipoyllysine-residue succinyltransferase subunit [Georgenia sp. Z1344]|uniref:multifunctional oxoglutarate decarboxylase/oxoglutarate dehydrogenase thiamine pyrophosphate-binding subunit/dihydrolipoyllysine-residue succinyltransferase subunit n=1 Tax=Georgenia sp. Z1344 TaxID=3416706 RepID=UPI003CFABEB0